ncbi:hypothetical protein J6590_106469, partial [Homalodisca vitripennis]
YSDIQARDVTLPYIANIGNSGGLLNCYTSGRLVISPNNTSVSMLLRHISSGCNTPLHSKHWQQRRFIEPLHFR